jgi:hypothetical protein
MLRRRSGAVTTMSPHAERSRVCSASFRFATRCAAPGTRATSAKNIDRGRCKNKRCHAGEHGHRQSPAGNFAAMIQFGSETHEKSFQAETGASVLRIVRGRGASAIDANTTLGRSRVRRRDAVHTDEKLIGKRRSQIKREMCWRSLADAIHATSRCYTERTRIGGGEAASAIGRTQSLVQVVY